MEKYPGLEVNEDFDFHRKMWVVQRVGWMIMALFLLAAALGAFGMGGTWTDQSGKASWGEVKYDRFLRWQAPTRIEFRISPFAARDGQIDLWVSNDYLDQWKIETVSPEPEVMLAGAERTVLRFRFESGEAPVPIMLYGQPENFGSLSGEMGIVGQSEALSIRQFAYP